MCASFTIKLIERAKITIGATTKSVLISTRRTLERQKELLGLLIHWFCQIQTVKKCFNLQKMYFFFNIERKEGNQAIFNKYNVGNNTTAPLDMKLQIWTLIWKCKSFIWEWMLIFLILTIMLKYILWQPS